MDHPLLNLVVAVVGLWFVVGLVLSVRQSVEMAAEKGQSKAVGGLVGIFLAVPLDIYLMGFAVLAAVVWRAM